jgi:Flp pilus assembly protein TadD
MLMDLDVALRDVAGLYQDGNLSAALEQARELVRSRPGMRMALLDLAHLERESGNLEAAVEALREAYALNPADNSTLALLGGYLTQAGKAAEAVEITGSHSRLAEPDVDVLLVHALAQARSGQTGAAFEVLEKARWVAPENPMVPVHTGTVYLMTGARELARGAFEAALALNPEMATAHTALGMMAIEEGRVDAGVEHWRQAVTADTQQCSRLLAFGTHLWDRGETSAGRSLLELFVASAPADTYRAEIARVRALLGGTPAAPLR